MAATGEGPFEKWAIVELMGHRIIGGLVTEEQRFGSTMLRVDVMPADDTGETMTQYYNSHSIFGLTLTSEDVARNVARANLQRLREHWRSGPRIEINMGPGEEGVGELKNIELT